MAKCGARFTPSGVLLPPTAVPVPVAPATPQFTSRFRGVCAERNKWRAQITIAGKKQFLGTFETQRQAAAAYDRAALRYHGAKAVTNFPAAPGSASPTLLSMDHDSDGASASPLSVGSVPSAATMASGHFVVPHTRPPRRRSRPRAKARPRGGSDEGARVRKPKRARHHEGRTVDVLDVQSYEGARYDAGPPAKRPAVVRHGFPTAPPSGATSPVPVTAVRLPLHLRRKNKARKLRTMVAMDAAARQAALVAAAPASVAAGGPVGAAYSAAAFGASVAPTAASGGTTHPQANFLLTLCDAALRDDL